MDRSWHTFAMTFDSATQELTGWLTVDERVEVREYRYTRVRVTQRRGQDRWSGGLV